jgi:hypothetical protein
MKAFNIIALSLTLAILGGLALCTAGEFYFGDSAKFVVAPLALALGFSARRIVQYFLGYTLEDSMKETSNDESKQ